MSSYQHGYLHPQRSPFVWRSCIRIPSEWQEHLRDVGVYVSGALFTLGWWFFIDGLVSAKTHENFGANLGFEDWLPGLISTFGMIIVNSIDLSLLNQEDGFGYEDSNSSVKAKATLFFGIALVAGGLAGSFAILVIKYTMAHLDPLSVYTGVSNVLQTICITVSTLVLLFVHNYESSSYQGIRLQ
ncbi:Vacuolar protein sorting-associated protein 68 [Spiromyces aspiralis]|uniref:Vacuolar protein sorting-associated protein 68 n=1 Tax=Spiromyces aspiralis TaxID=68401 RepID=A0ACC1HVT1_9FUNG|nr:Vacuolar protein sorting-associated protein 68 [Spiromyces aspiralis]